MILINLLIYLLASILQISTTGIEEPVYYISKAIEPIEINAVWDKEQWNNIQPLTIDEKVGKNFEFNPKVQAKIAYNQEAIYVIFKVEDRYVTCMTEKYQGSVYQDSCVEFFFTPGSDISNGYFNLEVNCIGTALFKYHDTSKDTLIEIPLSEFNKITIAHSISGTIKKEIRKPITWVVEYKLPFEVIEKYFDGTSVNPGQVWKANFYKIAARTSNPQRLSWVKLPPSITNFHRPEFFGTLKFK